MGSRGCRGGTRRPALCLSPPEKTLRPREGPQLVQPPSHSAKTQAGFPLGTPPPSPLSPSEAPVPATHSGHQTKPITCPTVNLSPLSV